MSVISINNKTKSINTVVAYDHDVCNVDVNITDTLDAHNAQSDHLKQSHKTMLIQIPQYLYDFMGRLLETGKTRNDLASKMLEKVLYQQHRYFIQRACE